VSPLDTAAGQAVYSPWVLRLYDAWVLGLSCTLAWRCPSARMLAQYDRLAGPRHLDVGVGSGFYLDRCRFPSPAPAITLLDLNPSSLAHAARRIARYSPRTVLHDVLAPLPLAERFDSVGASFLLHCLPGTMAEKAQAVARLAPAVAEGGVLFGSTILGREAGHNAFGRALLGAYNRRGIFSNLEDSEPGLRAALGASFAEVRTERVGTVALFEARRPRRASVA
jgi:SAM-dependent methyltransferase